MDSAGLAVIPDFGEECVEGSLGHATQDMERLGTLCSAYERRAEDATRDVEARLKCQFMEDKVGEAESKLRREMNRERDVEDVD